MNRIMLCLCIAVSVEACVAAGAGDAVPPENSIHVGTKELATLAESCRLL